MSQKNSPVFMIIAVALLGLLIAMLLKPLSSSRDAEPVLGIDKPSEPQPQTLQQNNLQPAVAEQPRLQGTAKTLPPPRTLDPASLQELAKMRPPPAVVVDDNKDHAEHRQLFEARLTDEQKQEIARLANRSHEGVEASVSDTGYLQVDMRGRFRSVPVAVIDDEGKLHIDYHGESYARPEAADEFEPGVESPADVGHNEPDPVSLDAAQTERPTATKDKKDKHE